MQFINKGGRIFLNVYTSKVDGLNFFMYCLIIALQELYFFLQTRCNCTLYFGVGHQTIHHATAAGCPTLQDQLKAQMDTAPQAPTQVPYRLEGGCGFGDWKGFFLELMDHLTYLYINPHSTD